MVSNCLILELFTMNLLATTPRNRIWAVLIFSMGMLAILTSSCKKETESSNTHQKTIPVTGTWDFTLSPDKSVQDTSLVKGIRGSEQEEYSSEFDNIYLYEDESGNITGDFAPFRFDGVHKEDSIILKVYNIKNGHYTPGIATKDMDQISTIRLSMDAFGLMKGHGTYLPNPDYDNAEKESYFVEARKRNSLTASATSVKETNSNVLHTLCNISASIDSWVISVLSGGIFRPIGNCYLEKDGGGYYVFGHYGPGSLLPICTQTVYYPLEWSWCKVRKYNFSIELKGEIRDVEALKWVVKHQPPNSMFYNNIGFESVDALNAAIDDFHNKFGDFAISLGYNLQTRKLAIYVNHSKGSDKTASVHYLIKNIASAFSPFVSKIYYFSGRNISDHWYLRRSEIGVCNTPLLFVYVLGTNQVEYN